MTSSRDTVPRRVGDYEILADLEAGGMGEVLLARRVGAHGFERLVALKTIRSDLRDREDIRTMFLDEARLLARLHHPAIAQVHDFGEDEGVLFLAMEYVAGLSFSELVGRMPAGVASRAVAEICRGLHAAHLATDLEGRELGVVHRDVSPQNLVLTFEGRSKILDFGIARTHERQAPATELGLIKGKPAYMSPEQLLGRRVDRRTDIFSICVVLYELLTGKRLFGGGAVLEVADRVRHMPVPPPSAAVRDLPPGLDDVVLGGLSRRLDERTPSAEVVAVELERIARVSGAESLETFARRELARERRAHERFLRDAASRRGMPRRTMNDATIAISKGAEPEADAVGPGRPEVGSHSGNLGGRRSTGTEPTEDAPTGTRRRRYRGVVATSLALAGCVAVAGAWLWPRPHSAEDEPASQPQAHQSAAGVDSPAAENVANGASDSGNADASTPETAQRSAETARSPTKKRSPSRRLKRRHRTATNPSKAAAEPATEPTGRAAGVGYVKVTSDPSYGNVRIDGVTIGPTPLSRYPLGAGEHTVEIVAPDASEVWHREVVQIETGRTIRVACRNGL